MKSKYLNGKIRQSQKAHKPHQYFLMSRLHYFLLLLICPLAAAGQFTYRQDQNIAVEAEGKTLRNPWAGGLNSPQVNTIDLNGDGKPDLAVYDRTASKVLTFLNIDNTYRYRPEYESLFPTAISRWMLLRDFNCDGRKDLFTANNNGISVYENITTPGTPLAWAKKQFFVPPAAQAPPGTPGIFTDILLTQGFSTTNIFPGTNDIPSITDMDGDGDLDIVNIRFVNPGSAEYHKNMSMENFGTCDSLSFVRISSRWGDWEECNCADFAFGESCTSTGGRTVHTGGKAIVTLDIDNDGDQDLLFGEEDCPLLFLLPNEGTTENADMNTALPFPPGTPVNIPAFTAPYLEDVDFDGIPDLIVTPTLFSRSFVPNALNQSVGLYKNTGGGQIPAFTFVKNNFLQEDMIDVGDNAFPAFTDFDGDGDEDLFIGNTGDNQFIGRIALFENTGTPSLPAFRLVTSDFAGLSQLGLFNIKPQFIDVTGDGNIDLAFLATDRVSITASLFYIPGNKPNVLDVSNQQVQTTEFFLSNNENIFLADIDQDGAVDILVGKSTGALEFWRNTGFPGSFSYALEDAAFMDLGSSITRTNLNAFVADLDADGNQDLLLGDQKGTLTIYSSFRESRTSPQPITDVIFDPFTETFSTKNLGGRIKPVAVNLFNSNRPAVAVGTVMGGMAVLKNDDSVPLPEAPVLIVFPNPVSAGGVLSVRSDRNAEITIFSIMGQQLSAPTFIAANQTVPVQVGRLAAGIYMMRFTVAGRRFSRKFVVN